MNSNKDAIASPKVTPSTSEASAVNMALTTAWEECSSARQFLPKVKALLTYLPPKHSNFKIYTSLVIQESNAGKSGCSVNCEIKVVSWRHQDTGGYSSDVATTTLPSKPL